VSDRILVRGLEVFARHGAMPEEARLGQRFSIDVTAHLDLRPAGESDDLRKTVDYDALVRLAIATFTARRFSLIEAAAEAVAQAVLAAFPAVGKVEVEVRKPAAPIDAVFGSVGVAVERSRGA
jgi:dihydroneopterin aldolase